MITQAQVLSLFKPLHLPPSSKAALGILGGILTAANQQTTLAIIVIFAFFCLFFFLNKKKALYNLIFISIGALCSFGSYHYQHQKSPLAQFYHQPINLEGSITDYETVDGNFYRHRLHMTINAVIHTEKKFSIHDELWIYLRQAPTVMVADTISLQKVTLSPISNEEFQSYLIKEGISHTIFLKDSTTIQTINRPSYSLRRRLHTIKNNLVSRISKKMSYKTATLFNSIFLGKKNRSKSYEKIKEQFKIWGISHQLARSGLHLVLFIFIWEFLLGLLPLNFFAKQIITLLLAAFYSIFSWSTTSFLRALGTFFIYKFSILTNHQIHGMHTILLVGSILLLFNPTLLFFLDFQLSFLFAYILSLVLPSFNESIRAS